ncbi:unnamed protein product [Lactuca saligna]|uniref:COPA/B TPR domain-containing protein n=1 Tax=Lactuca saligna TaxID=75948 RepID=A0AA35YW43_LACSI|nr:unnamed protein product [Lactuca saligna]
MNSCCCSLSCTRDGTSDAPALHEDDISLAMGIQRTEVAKESSDIVILEDNFASIVKSRGMIDEALAVTTCPDYRFELAMQLGKLEIVKDIVLVAQSELKWKQLSELAMSTGLLEMAKLQCSYKTI